MFYKPEMFRIDEKMAFKFSYCTNCIISIIIIIISALYHIFETYEGG